MRTTSLCTVGALSARTRRLPVLRRLSDPIPGKVSSTNYSTQSTFAILGRTATSYWILSLSISINAGAGRVKGYESGAFVFDVR
jgi:hypothetical protein